MNDFEISLRDLPHQAGSLKEVDLSVPAPADLGNAMIGAKPGSPVRVQATLTSMTDGVLVSGSAQVQIAGECGRCLDEISYEQDIDFSEMFFLPEVAAKLTADSEAEDADELFTISDEDSVDLEPVLRDALVLKLPFQPLCSDDCPGLCQECGQRLADLPADHHHEILDPRWSALRSLLEEE